MLKFILAMLLSVVVVLGTWKIEARRFRPRPGETQLKPGEIVAFDIGTIRRAILYSPYFWIGLLLVWGVIYSCGKW